MNSDTIVLGKYGGTRSNALPRRHYDLVKKVILMTLLQKGEVTLTFLLTVATEQLGGLFRDQVHWNVLQVKIDLHVREMIKISFAPGCIQIIKINPRYLKEIKRWMRTQDY